ARTPAARDHSRAGPVGRPRVGLRQEGELGVVQQRRVMNGERRDNQDLAPRRARSLEMQQLAERLVEGDFDLGLGNVPGRLLVALRDSQEQLAGRGEPSGEGRVSERTEWVPEPA